MLAGLIPSCPDAKPAPDRDTMRLGLDAVLSIDTLPIALPAAFGVKSTVKVML
jgi:hypothetical protein